MSLDNLNNNIYPLSLDGLTTINADSIIINGNNLDPASYVPYIGASTAVNLGNNKITTVYIPSNPEDLVNKFYTDGKFLTLVDASNNYLKISTAQSTYATQSSLSNYLTLVDASNNYLKISTAQSTYATISDLNLYLLSSTAASTYATQASLPSYNFTGTPTITSAPSPSDDSDKIPTTHWVRYAMSLIYLPITTADSDYLKKTDAASTYATITNLNLKAPLASPTFTGLITLPSTVRFSTNPSSGTGSLLAINGAGNIITTSSSLNQTSTSTSGTYYIPFVSSSSSGAFVPLVYSTLMCNPNTGLITASRLTATTQIETYSMKITNVPNAILDSLLAVDIDGNVIKGYLTQTASTTNADYNIIFTQYSGTGAFIPLNESTLTYNPSTKNLKTSKLQITGVIAGSQQYLLAIDSLGNVIRGTAAAGGDAYLANNQTFTGINTFNNNVIVPSGAILFAHYLYASTAILQITAQYGITANLPTGDFVVGLNSTSGLSIAGDHTLGVFAVDTLRIGYQTFPKLRFWNASTYIEWVTNSQGCDFKNATDTTFSYNQIGIFMYKPTSMNIGGWIPANGTSLYMTDTFPSTGTNNYSRYFAIGQIVYQDFFNKFMWRRDSFATGTSVVEIMSLDSNGLTLQNAVGLGQPQLTFAGSGVPTIKATGNGINWSMNGTNSGYFDMNAWSAGYGWRINANQFMTMQCAYDMVIKCKVGGVSQPGANNRYIQIVTPNSLNSHQDIGGGGWYAGACVFRPEENNGNSGTGIGISMSSSTAYGGNNWGYFTAVNPGNYWLNWSFGGAVGYWCVNNTVCAYINSTSGWQAASDERCKRDIQDLNTKKSLQRVLKCKPKHYKRILKEPKGENPIPLKQEDIDRVHIGLLAQEVLEYNPHCVSNWEDDDDNGGKVERLGIAYQDFIIHLIGSVQEQQQQISDQKEVIKNQEHRIKHLEDSITQHNILLSQIVEKLNKNVI